MLSCFCVYLIIEMLFANKTKDGCIIVMLEHYTNTLCISLLWESFIADVRIEM